MMSKVVGRYPKIGQRNTKGKCVGRNLMAIMKGGDDAPEPWLCTRECSISLLFVWGFLLPLTAHSENASVKEQHKNLLSVSGC
jgi:hypothetical protein